MKVQAVYRTGQATSSGDNTRQALTHDLGRPFQIPVSV